MCWKCGKSIEQEFVGRADECDFCKTDLHSCRNCIFFAQNAHWECVETVDERILDKEKRNFCPFFKVKRDFSAQNAQNSAQEKARVALKSLFGN